MILFYEKDSGNVFAVVDGRVHTKQQENVHISSGQSEDNIGKFIIGFLESEDGLREPFNMEYFDLLQEFESTSTVNPLDYKINENGQLIPKINIQDVAIEGVGG